MVDMKINKEACWKSFKAEAATVGEKLKALIREGSVRRIVVEHKGQTVAEFPLTAGVLGVVVAPVLAAVGALVALLKECTIHVEHAEPTAAAAPAGTAAAHTPVDAEC
jgi:D-aminopeptidase